MQAVANSSPSARTVSLKVRTHTGQSATLKAKEPINAGIAGTGGGKTVSGEVWLLQSMVKRPNESWLVAEPTWPMVDRILMTSSQGRPSLLKLIQHLDPGAIYKKSERAIYSRLGTVLLASATHPESMEGAHCAGAWLDEAGQMSRLAFETAVRRVTFKSTGDLSRSPLVCLHYSVVKDQNQLSVG